MKVASLPHFGPSDSFEVVAAPMPAPGKHEILIEVVAAGVNRADVLQRRGMYRSPAGAPPWPGLEVSGRVAAIGPRTTRWAVGDTVCALLPGGGYSEYTAVHEGLALPAPEGISLVHAAGLMEAACTVWSNLATVDTTAGKTILIHGGSGGIGTTAIQVAKAMGLRVVATAGGADRAERCIALGAEVAIDYRSQDFVTEVAKLGGADIILDVVGGGYLKRNLAALRDDGAILMIGLQQGAAAEVNLATLLGKRASIMGTTLRSRPLKQRIAIVQGVGRDIWPLIPDQLQPVIHAVFPLEDVALAHRVMDEHAAFGKVLLSIV